MLLAVVWGDRRRDLEVYINLSSVWLDFELKSYEILRSTKQLKAVQTGFTLTIFSAEMWTEGGRVYFYKAKQTTIVGSGDTGRWHLDKHSPSETDQ